MGVEDGKIDKEHSTLSYSCVYLFYDSKLWNNSECQWNHAQNSIERSRDKEPHLEKSQNKKKASEEVIVSWVNFENKNPKT